MINNIYMKSKKAFTLVELAIVMAVIGVLAMVATPRTITFLNTRVAQKTAVEMKQIQDAAKWYYVANSTWPVDITTLQTDGYLDPSWPTNNLFGNAYTISSTANSFTIQSNIPAACINAAAQILPQAVVAGESLSSTVPLPGSESSHENLLHRLAAATQVQRTLEGDIYTQGLIYNDADNTYLLDLSASGTSYLHRINADDIYLRQLGIWLSNFSAIPAGTIAIWSGSVASIPSGWYLCNGANSTPNLRDRFVVGAGGSYAVGATGGATTHNHTYSGSTSTPSNYQQYDGDQGTMSAMRHTHTYSGTTSSGSSLPPYYALCYIMKG